MTTEAPKELRDRVKRLTTLKLTDIVGFEAGNPVNRTARDEELLDASLDRGYAMPVLVRELAGHKYETIDGHGRISRILARFPGTTEIKVLVIDAETTTEAREIMLGLRNAASWDLEELNEWIADGLTDGLDLETAMGLTGFTAADLDVFGSDDLELLGATEDDEEEESKPSPPPAIATRSTLVVEVDIPEKPAKKTVTQPGDVWILGDHRLVCGDMTVPEIRAAAHDGITIDLVFADPPSVTEISDALEKPGAKRKTVSAPDYIGMIGQWCGALSSIDVGTPLYAITPDSALDLFASGLRQADFRWSSWISWVQQSIVQSRRDYHPQWLPIWYGWKNGGPRRCAPSDRAASDVWTIDRPRKAETNPSARPTSLPARAIANSSEPGATVFDPFAGAGSTLLAAEQLGRRCFAIEIDPAMCDVAIDRWQRLTGHKARRK